MACNTVSIDLISASASLVSWKEIELIKYFMII